MNAQQQAGGGSTSADALSVVTSDVAIVPQITTRQSMQLPLGIQSSPVSSPANDGFMIIAPAKPSTDQNSLLRFRILWNSLRLDLLDGFRTTGNHVSAIKTLLFHSRPLAPCYRWKPSFRHWDTRSCLSVSASAHHPETDSESDVRNTSLQPTSDVGFCIRAVVHQSGRTFEATFAKAGSGSAASSQSAAPCGPRKRSAAKSGRILS